MTIGTAVLPSIVAVSSFFVEWAKVGLGRVSDAPMRARIALI